MIDLHSHLLPGIDDGASELAQSLAMARMAVADGVTVMACTPHILPGLYHNTGPGILAATQQLRNALADAQIDLEIVTGADAHMVPDFVVGLKQGRILSLAQTRYVLVEPPHHVAPVRIEDFFFEIAVAGYVPILTHPERLSWIADNYDIITRLAHAGVWMQITAGSLAGIFGRVPLYWAERMLDEGLVHILASDAHNIDRRPPNLGLGRTCAARRVGDVEAEHLVVTRPRGILDNKTASELPMPNPVPAHQQVPRTQWQSKRRAGPQKPQPGGGETGPNASPALSLGQRVRRLFK